MKFYRYNYFLNGGYGRDLDGEIVPSIFPPTPNIYVETYDLLKETPKGYWITDANDTQLHYVKDLIFKKWISKTAKKRFAYPTENEAKINFVARQKRRLKILKSQIRTVESLISISANL